jgi:membrane protease YdiL (CAAX protease family)
VENLRSQKNKPSLMNDNLTTVLYVNIAATLFWGLAVVFILVCGQFLESLKSFKAQMILQWKPALIIAISYLLSQWIGGGTLLNFYVITIFCQALLGLTFTSSIHDFDTLPIIRPLNRKEQLWKSIFWMIFYAMVLMPITMALGNLGTSIGTTIFNETIQTGQALEMLPANKWSLFFVFFSGAGLAEETAYRLLFLSFFWYFTRRRWLAILLSALLFGLYHLSPLDQMYATFWQFPISQVLSTTFIGLVWGFIYSRRGFETAVLSHTLHNWLPIILLT